ncbi:HAL/PAL/TAL family ammonia-lyase [Paenibacillus segetis]|uniref:Phenylalanine ammonia-lyase n=1 Tax=Paenibacillus segetis TaxID=1325360 RepID=A0ABQ1YC43_9BACL|nr:aromatic amino acid ammonia-lyase [Paenibacillus segetis]GGH19749.1 phenylalanine ammonia-lyase [Paenibacillus segetis]
MPNDVLILDGQSLTVADVYTVAYGRRPVQISEEAIVRVKASRDLIFELAEQDVPVYGLNRGVGWNKDRVIDKAFFERFNRNLILSHSAGVGAEAAEEEVRAVMLVRLNALLLGCTGVQLAIVQRYVDFLNLEIHPMLPLKGSVGAADITILSHIGLSFIGEGEVVMNGERLPTEAAMNKAGLKPLVLGPKDGLAIVSSNALSAGTGALVLHECEEILELADIVYALSLEALRGNVSPLDEAVHRVRPYKGQLKSVAHVRDILKQSYLWNSNLVDSLQDPLSFRGACQIHGAAYDALQYTREQLHIHLNSSDDNPCVLLEEKRILSCANFESVSWTLGFEMLGSALHHVSKSACYRTIKLGTPSFTGLSRFLTANEEYSIGYCTVQKTITALDAEIRHLSNPASADYFSLAGDLEDHAANSPYVVAKTRDIIDRLYYIIGIEALHAVQAIDLRKDLTQGLGTKAAYESIRSAVPFLGEDRNLSIDIEQAYQLLKSGQFLAKVRASLIN